MRKIEQQMIRAIKDRRDWRGGNTAVFIETCGNPFGTRAEIFLHGNHIATYWYGDGVVSDNPLYNGSREVSCEPEHAMFRTWPTKTTRSRLRALGIDACIRKGVAVIDGKEC